MADSPAELRAKIAHYRQMLGLIDDPALREALEHLIRLANEKLGDHHSKLKDFPFSGARPLRSIALVVS